MSKTNKQARVGFLSFFKLNLLYGIALGQLAGAWFMVIQICGGPVHLNLGSWHIEGMPAAIGSLILLPPALGLIALLTAPLVFLPFTLASRIFGGFKMS